MLAFWLLFLPVFLLFAIAGYVIGSFFLMRVFEKAGVQGKWRAWVPVYNLMVLAKLGDLSPWIMLGAIVASSLLSQMPGHRLALLPRRAGSGRHGRVARGTQAGQGLAVPAPVAHPRHRRADLARHPRLRQVAVEPEHRSLALAQLVPQGQHRLAGHPRPARSRGRRARRRGRGVPAAGRLPATRRATSRRPRATQPPPPPAGYAPPPAPPAGYEPPPAATPAGSGASPTPAVRRAAGSRAARRTGAAAAPEPPAAEPPAAPEPPKP